MKAKTKRTSTALQAAFKKWKDADEVLSDFEDVADNAVNDVNIAKKKSDAAKADFISLINLGAKHFRYDGIIYTIEGGVPETLEIVEL